MLEWLRRRLVARPRPEMVRVVDADRTGATDASGAFNEALASLGQYEPSELPVVEVPHGAYRIAAPLIPPPFEFALVGRGRPVLLLDDLPPGPVLRLDGGIYRGSTLANLTFKDSLKSRTKTGPRIASTSWLRLVEIQCIGLLKGLVFDNVHDSRGLDGLAFYDNAIDLCFEGAKSSSLGFTNCRLENTRWRCIEDGALPHADLSWTACGFAPRLVDPGVGLHLGKNALTGCRLTRCRLESKTPGSTNLRFDGQSSSIPSIGLTVEQCYLTGGVRDHIVVGPNVSGIALRDNVFLSRPQENDLDYLPTRPEFTIEMRNNSAYGRVVRTRGFA